MLELGADDADALGVVCIRRDRSGERADQRPHRLLIIANPIKLALVAGVTRYVFASRGQDRRGDRAGVAVVPLGKQPSVDKPVDELAIDFD